MALCNGGKSGEAICMYYWVHLKDNKKEANACKKRVSRMDEEEDLDVEDLEDEDVEEVDLEEEMRSKGMCKKGCKQMFGKKVGPRLMKECMELCKGGKSGEAICMYYWVHGKNNKKEAEACKKRVSKARMDEVEDLDVEDLEDEDVEEVDLEEQMRGAPK